MRWADDFVMGFEHKSQAENCLAELKDRMHHPVQEQGKWLKSVVEGHSRYYGVPGNAAPSKFRFAIAQTWWKTLRRRGNRRKLPWRKMEKIVDQWLPQVKLHHPYPLKRMGVIT